ncbi:BatD family protein [Porticoccaceae bacterium]|nr:BatD family protein [Porticoccaceae bacterium]
MNRVFKNNGLILLLLVAIPSWASLSSTVDRTQIETNETLQLTVRYSGKAPSGDPDFSAIEKDFSIASNSRQQQYSWVNGESTSYTDWKILLIPKRQGKLTVPSLNFMGSRSQAIGINVRPANTSASTSSGQPVFIETTVDKDMAFIQEQVILTHRLHYSVPLQDISISEFEIPDAIIQQVSEERFNKRINGKNYSIIEIKFALFGQSVGKLNIPSQRFTAFETSNSGLGGFFSRGNRVIRLTEEKIVDIAPIPTHLSASQWMPSSQVRLEQSWSDNSGTLTAGEPITRTINISALGLTAAQIQPLPSVENSQLKLYPDQPSLEDKQTNRGILGVRTESLAIVPNQAGQIRIPAIEIEWWDTVNNRMQTSRLPSKTFNVVAGNKVNQISDQQQAISQPVIIGSDSNKPVELPALTRWSLGLNALLIALLVGLFYWRKTPVSVTVSKTPKSVITAKHQLKKIEQLAANNQLAEMRDRLLHWGAEVFPQQPPRSLNQLADLMENSELKQQFSQLDQSLFKADSSTEFEVESKTIIKALKQFVPVKITNHSPRKELKPLYPE